MSESRSADSDPAHGPDPRGGDTLRVELDVRPREELSCPVVDADGDVADVRVNAIGGECNADLRVEREDGGTDLVRATDSVDDECLCHRFQRSGCVPHIRDVRDGTMIVAAYADDRETVRELIAELRPVSESVRLIRLTVVGEEGGDDLVTFDLSRLTAKQREALELAVVEGYYDDDGGADLGTLSDELGISKSALSQRLRVAQSKLVGDLFRHC